ncbi:uncharacterized protein aq_987-like [Saccoglossus kowalevskii]|uniref:Uncharacterized protein LOC100375269 n=1 Tax=Saccoglossus kowalevskii TaxID=10224 RepID=A0ABM0GPC0_SACKO|nr:PREDICTED: uncharacterized protein LOC100375269 [Saccoglossus kowalevskii]
MEEGQRKQRDESEEVGSSSLASLPAPKTDVVYRLRDIKRSLVEEWTKTFEGYDNIQVSQGDIFEGAPSADAIVSPANSFGFMDGGIDGVYSAHFGWQMQKRLQKVIREEKDGEILVGDTVIIPTFEGGAKEDSMDWSAFNGGKPIKYLISAPTMRVPEVVAKTPNAFLAFRAVILAVQKHNANLKEGDIPIKSVISPGLGTSVGKMPSDKCAAQMKLAYDMFELGLHREFYEPEHLTTVWEHHYVMCEEATL